MIFIDQYMNILRGAWVAQSVKHLTLDFGLISQVRETEPRTGLHVDGAKPAWDVLSPSLSAPPLFTHVLSLSK